MSPSPYVVRQDAVTPYSPLNHEATVNRRLVGRDNVGARQLEVVLGVVARGGGALKHSHPGIQQACYVLEGRGPDRGGPGPSSPGRPGATPLFPPGAPPPFTPQQGEPAQAHARPAPPPHPGPP